MLLKEFICIPTAKSFLSCVCFSVIGPVGSSSPNCALLSAAIPAFVAVLAANIPSTVPFVKLLLTAVDKSIVRVLVIFVNMSSYALSNILAASVKFDFNPASKSVPSAFSIAVSPVSFASTKSLFTSNFDSASIIACLSFASLNAISNFVVAALISTSACSLGFSSIVPLVLKAFNLACDTTKF